jgi:hypothetical protein
MHQSTQIRPSPRAESRRQPPLGISATEDLLRRLPDQVIIGPTQLRRLVDQVIICPTQLAASACAAFSSSSMPEKGDKKTLQLSTLHRAK